MIGIADNGDSVSGLAGTTPVTFQTPGGVISTFMISDYECLGPEE